MENNTIETTPDEIEFLRESNAIEDVFDSDSLKQALSAWDYLKIQSKLTPTVVLKTHKILMLHQDIKPYQKGYFRDVRVRVGNREGMPHKDIANAIGHWCGDANNSVRVPGENGNNIKIDHIQYEKIHPFIDGNGRTGRMFMNWQRLHAGLPILIIKASGRGKYYQWFR